MCQRLDPRGRASGPQSGRTPEGSQLDGDPKGTGICWRIWIIESRVHERISQAWLFSFGGGRTDDSAEGCPRRPRSKK